MVARMTDRDRFDYSGSSDSHRVTHRYTQGQEMPFGLLWQLTKITSQSIRNVCL